MKQLLQKVYQYYLDRYRPDIPKFYPGWCIVARVMKDIGMITEDEKESLWDYIDDNRPKLGDKYCDKRRIDYGYFWKEHDFAPDSPRVLWMKELIKNCKE